MARPGDHREPLVPERIEQGHHTFTPACIVRNVVVLEEAVDVRLPPLPSVICSYLVDVRGPNYFRVVIA